MAGTLAYLTGCDGCKATHAAAGVHLHRSLVEGAAAIAALVVLFVRVRSFAPCVRDLSPSLTRTQHIHPLSRFGDAMR